MVSNCDSTERRSDDGGSFVTGKKCYICGYWQFDRPTVHMPTIPPPDGKFTKSPEFMAACRNNGRKSNLGFVRAAVLLHLDSIKFWQFNGDSAGVVCAKLAAKGVTICRTSLGAHLNAIAAEREAS
jgi:hypothetical protein